MSVHNQAVAAAKASDKTAQQFADAVRDALAIANHASATGLAANLATLQKELADHRAFMAGDQSGDPPAGTVPNPKRQPELIDQYVERRDADGKVVVANGVVQYDVRQVRNPKYNPDIQEYIFESTTGLQVDADGKLQGTDNTIETLSLRLAIAGAIDALREQDIQVDGAAVKFGTALEKAVVIE